MNTRAQLSLTRPLVVALAMAMGITPAAFTPVATAQSYGYAQEQPAFSQQELDQMLAPIALYPDSLLSQILMASTYPLEVVQAARWSRANSHLRGDAAVRAVESQDWDPSVKSLVAFPQILEMMDQKLDWTERLGDAFLDQQPQVMDSVQQLRQRAYAAGNLRSDDRIRVIPQDRLILVEPAQPQVIYVPYYNPTVVYGPWWWPGYPPVYWSPWPGYYARPGISVNLFWGSGIALSSGFFFGGFDWHSRQARVVNVHNNYYNRNVIVNRSGNAVGNGSPGEWRHDPDHRRGVPYRAAAQRQQVGRTGDGSGNGRDSTTTITNQNERRDARLTGPRVENNAERRTEGRDRNDNRPDVRDQRSPSLRTPPSSAAQPTAQVRSDVRADAPAPGTIVRPDSRERNDNRRDSASGRPDVRAQDNNVRPEPRITAPRENNNDRRPEGRGRNDNRSDAADARSLSVPSVAGAVARPEVSRSAESGRVSPAVRADARPELHKPGNHRAAIQESRPQIENRSATIRATAAEIRSAPVSAAPREQNRPEPQRLQQATVRQQPAGDGAGRGGRNNHESRRDEQKR